jgi:hypothetical protein
MWVGGSDYLGQFGNSISLSSQSTPTTVAYSVNLEIKIVTKEIFLYPIPLSWNNKDFKSKKYNY